MRNQAFTEVFVLTADEGVVDDHHRPWRRLVVLPEISPPQQRHSVGREPVGADRGGVDPAFLLGDVGRIDGVDMARQVFALSGVGNDTAACATPGTSRTAARIRSYRPHAGRWPRPDSRLCQRSGHAQVWRCARATSAISRRRRRIGSSVTLSGFGQANPSRGWQNRMAYMQCSPIGRPIACNVHVVGDTLVAATWGRDICRRSPWKRDVRFQSSSAAAASSSPARVARRSPRWKPCGSPRPAPVLAHRRATGAGCRFGWE